MFTLPDSKRESETDKKDVLRIVWRCSYYSETETGANFQTVLYTFYQPVSVSVTVSGSVNEQLRNKTK